MDAEGNKTYKEVDLELSRFLIEMRLALKEHHDVDYIAVNYLKIFYKKFKAVKSLSLYSVLCEKMADFKASHKFASSSEVFYNALEVGKIWIQNLCAPV